MNEIHTIHRMTAEQEETFINLWDAAQANGQEYYHDFRALAQEIRPGLTDAEFDKGWQYCQVTGPQRRYARLEFLMLVNQTF